MVNLFVALAPVAYIGNSGGLLNLLAKIDFDTFFPWVSDKSFLPATILQTIAPGLCHLIPYGCKDVLGRIGGKINHLNCSRIEVYVSETPAGTSVKNIAHWFFFFFFFFLVHGFETDPFF